MKLTLLCLCGLLLLVTGCANQYVIKLKNTAVLYSKTKPRLNERGFYVYTDMEGQAQQVNAMRVIEIEAK